MRLRLLTTFVFLIVMTGFMTGCSMFSPVKTEPKSTYVLNTIPKVPRQSTRPITILVMPPETRPVFNTTEMAYTTKPYQIAYFSQNQWAETPSQMLQPLIVQTLQNTHFFHAVVTPPYMGRYDYMLNTRIETLEQNFIHCRGCVKFTVAAQLIRMSTNQVIASKTFSVSRPMRMRTPYGGVLAANCAVTTILKDLAAFTVNNIK